ncbi:AMP-binding protein [bacterium]|nr:AMP-binding protein [bacterium]
MSVYTNVAVYLSRMATETPDKPAIYYPTKRDSNGRMLFSSQTFQQLENESNRIARGLLAMGIQPGTRAVLMVKPSAEFFALTFGLLKCGIIPVMVDPGMGATNLKKCFEESQPQTFIGIPKAQIARKLLGWGRNTIKTIITVFPKFFTWGLSLDQVKAKGGEEPFFKPLDPEFRDPFNPDDIAAINFTSGSTGVPKGAVYTHGIFSAQVDLIRDAYGIQSGEIDLCTFPLFALFAPALGMTAIIPEMDFTRPAHVNPKDIAETIEDFQPTNMFGSPALLNTVGRWCKTNSIRFPSLRRIICAGAPINPEILRYITATLSNKAQVFSGYGATEAMPLSTIGSNTILSETCHGTDTGKGVCVGAPNKGISLEIIGISDKPIDTWSDSLCLKPGNIGEIVAHGSVVTQSYFNRESATRSAKIFDPKTGRYRHRMGDLGWIDDKNRLWFCGRKNHRIETTEGPLFTIPVEGVFNTHPKVYRTALVGLGTRGSQKPVLCVELENAYASLHRNSTEKELFFTELMKHANQFPQAQTVNKFILHKSFPVDIRHNSKIFREKLQNWVEKKMV